MKCKTCSHPQRQAIDLDLLVKNHTFETLSQKYSLSISSLFRHKQHLVEKMERTRQRLRNSQQQGSLLKLNAILEQVQRAVQTAEADGNVDKVLKGAHVGSRIIHQITKMEVPLELDTVYRLISSPQWVSQDSLLPTDPSIITGIHQTLADIAFFPCPDPEPEIIPAAPPETQNPELATPDTCPDPSPKPDADVEDDVGHDEAEAEAETDDAAKDIADYESIPETINSELRTQDSELFSDLELFSQLQQLLARLSLTADNGGETAPKNQREKSAKLPKNSPLPTEFNKQYHIDNQCGKNLAKNPPMPTLANRNSELRTQGSELLSCKGREGEVPSAIRLDSKAPPANSEGEAPPAVKKLSPCPAQSNTLIIETRQTANCLSNRKPETVNQPLETSSSAPDPVRQALPFLVPKSVLESNQPHPSDPYQEDCIVPLKNERYRRGGIY